jgi:hypothetical protein
MYITCTLGRTIFLWTIGLADILISEWTFQEKNLVVTWQRTYIIWLEKKDCLISTDDERLLTVRQAVYSTEEPLFLSCFTSLHKGFRPVFLVY